MKAAKASRPTRKVLQDRTNQGEETKEGSVAVKKQVSMYKRRVLLRNALCCWL